MLTEKLYQVTLKKVEGEKETAKMGLAWLGHCLKDYGIDKIIDRYNPTKANKEIKTSEKIMVGALSIIAGAERIEDIENLRADKGLINNLGLKKIISPDTLREHLKVKKNNGITRKGNEDIMIKAMKKTEVKEFTYDNDATYFDSGKESAAYSYQKKKQFSGLLGFIAELGLCNTVDFRRGNVSPQSGILNQIRKAVRQAKAAGKKIKRFRGDSAAHQNAIFRECDAKGIEYYISLDKNAAVVECIKALTEKHWKELPKEEEDDKSVEWAETVYVTGAGIGMRMLVLRWKNPNPDLFDKSAYCYHAIGTNNNDIEPLEWLRFHNGRMNSENYNKEVKNGFNCDYTPSHGFEMNRGYFLLGILAYNMVQIMKLFYLGEATVKWTIKTLRYKFINVCGKIIKTGRQYFCKIINVTDSVFELFENCLARLVYCG